MDALLTAFGVAAELGERVSDDPLAWLERLFFWPGDRLVSVLLHRAPALAALLGLDSSGYRAVVAAFIAALAWLALLVVLSTVYAAIRDLDEAMTRGVVRLHAEIRRRIRVWAALLAYRLRRVRRAQPPAVVELLEEPELSDAELRVLLVHTRLPPGRALTVSEIARALGVRRHETERALARLRRLNLLTPALSGLDGEPAFALTPAGRAFSRFRRVDKGAAQAGARPATTSRPR